MTERNYWGTDSRSPGKKSPAFMHPNVHYHVRKTRHRNLSWAGEVESTPSNPIPWVTVLILSSHLNFVCIVIFPMHSHVRTVQHSSFDRPFNIWRKEELWNSSCDCVSLVTSCPQHNHFSVTLLCFVATWLVGSFCSCRWGEAMSLNCGHQRAYCSSRRWYMSMANHGSMILTGETEELGETPAPVSLCPPQIQRAPNPSLRGERPATNHLSHGTALVTRLLLVLWWHPRINLRVFYVYAM
jgi:hypothetical protein